MSDIEIKNVVVSCVGSVISGTFSDSETLVCSELDSAEIIIKLESSFGIDLPDNLIFTPLSINNLIDEIKTKIGE